MSEDGGLVVGPGDKLLACHRRLFDSDEPRFFARQVLSSSDSLIKIRGYSHSRNLNTGHFDRKGEVRTKILSVSGAYVLYELPRDISIESLQVVSEADRSALP